MQTNLQAGDHAVCIKDRWKQICGHYVGPTPVVDTVYTILKVRTSRVDPQIFVELVEFPNVAFTAESFRKVYPTFDFRKELTREVC